MRRGKTYIRYATLLCGIGIAFAALFSLIGMIGRDTTNATQWMYFIPALYVAILCLGFALIAWTASRYVRITLALLSLPSLVKVLYIDTRWGAAEPPEPGDLHVVHWNVARGRMGWDKIYSDIRGESPDILMLSETGNSSNLVSELTSNTGLPFAHAEDGMAVVSKYPVLLRDRMKLGGGRGWSADVLTPRQILRVAVVDVESKPNMNRAIPLGDVRRWLDGVPTNSPLLVVGDFNTPRDFHAFDALRTQLRHSYEESGSGWPYTWPSPLPAFSIDHIWLGGAVRSVDSVYRWGLRSDHARQVVSLRFPSTAKDRNGQPFFTPPPFPGSPGPR